MNNLIERIRATMDDEAAAIDAYHQHREHGPHINYPGQKPDDYDEYDSCSTCIATAEAIRFHRPNTGRSAIDAHRQLLDDAEAALHAAYETPTDARLAYAASNARKTIGRLADVYGLGGPIAIALAETEADNEIERDELIAEEAKLIRGYLADVYGIEHP